MRNAIKDNLPPVRGAACCSIVEIDGVLEVSGDKELADKLCELLSPYGQPVKNKVTQ